MKYRVIHNVEIGGVYYLAKDRPVVDESVFAPAPPMREHDDPSRPHLSELESLLATKHIEPE